MEQVAPAVRQRRQTYRRPVPPWTDVALAGTFVVLTSAEALYSPDVRSPALHMVVAGLAMAGLAWRRHFPIAVAAVVIAAVRDPRVR
ncbi:MAG: hypothetical protein ACRDPJ_19295 [Nocardioidaceae bacterium]